MACVVRKAGNKISKEDIITFMENKVLILFDFRIDNQHKHQTNETALLTHNKSKGTRNKNTI